MPLEPHTIKDYDTVLRNKIMEKEGFDAKVYYHDRDTPTIGYGLALYDKGSGRKVDSAFDNITDANIAISKADYKLFDKIETEMKASSPSDKTIKGLVDKLSLDLENEATGQKVLDNTLAGHYTNIVRDAIGDTQYNALKDSKELVTLVDMAYNAGSALFGPGFKHAMSHENRAEVWFQIRYDSNSGESRKNSGKGIANRRVSQSDMFGLYDETPSAEGMKDIIRMARFHATKIATEESAFPVTTSSSSANPYAGDNGITHQIQAAKDYLIKEFGKDVTIDGKLIVGNDSINDNSANRGQTKINDTNLKGGSKNDLIFGEKGNDTLRGYAGDDVLSGGEGKDKLYGGSGDDIYMAGEGDTINDSDNTGKIYFDATLLSGVKHKVSEGVYEDDMFSYTKTNGTLVISQKEDASKSVTVENWDAQTQKALDIELSEEKVNEVNNTNEVPNSILPESINNYLEQFDGNIDNNIEIQQE